MERPTLATSEKEFLEQVSRYLARSAYSNEGPTLQPHETAYALARSQSGLPEKATAGVIGELRRYASSVREEGRFPTLSERDLNEVVRCFEQNVPTSDCTINVSRLRARFEAKG